MPTINVTLADDKAYVLEHVEVGNELALTEALRARNQSKADSFAAAAAVNEAARDAIGARINAGLTRQNAAAAAALGGDPTDFALEHDNPAPGDLKIHTDAEAAAYRATL